MKTLLITGGTGYLGQRLLPIAAASAHVVATARDPSAIAAAYQPQALDITDPNQVESVIAAVRPDAVIHAAAINPGVDDARMESVNVDGTRYLAQSAESIGARFVMVSTDVLHDGRNAVYADDAAPTPINLYGRTKAAGEAACLAAHSQAIAVRTSLIYGTEAMDRGTQGFVDRLGRGGTLTLFSDVLRQPVSRDALATGLVRLALEFTEETGTLNLTGSDVLDRATFAEQMLNFWQIRYAPESVQRIRAADRADLSEVPLDCRVSLTRAKALGLSIPGVFEVLNH